MLELFKLKKKPYKRKFQLNELIEILQDGVCISNANGELIYLNKAAYFLLNIEQGSDIADFNFFTTFIKDLDKEKFLREQLEQQGFVRNFELQLKTYNNESIDVILTINLIGDFRQEIFGYLFLFKDVSELKKIQQQLLQSQKLESIGLMASGIAHDFNNILAAIIPNSELIKISTKPGNPNYKRAEIIEKSAHRASEIAQRLLTFTRQGEHQNNEMIDLNRVIDESLELIEHRLTDNIRIEKNYQPRLKYIFGDTAQVQQIIMNIVLNSIDAMTNGGMIYLNTENFHIDQHYQIGALDPGDYIKLRIRDTGSGIPLNVLSKIFDPFFTTKDIGKGTGLGLSVVYGIVKSMGGHIDVSSEVNKGTKFDLYFPIDYRDDEIESGEKIFPKDKQNLKLIIVDDEDYVLNILADTLEYLGYDVVKFNSGQSTLKYFKKYSSQINYAIIDLKMPQMDGRIVARELSQINPNVKIIFTSGYDDHPFPEEKIPGVIGFLKKPYSIKQVSRSLKEIFMNEQK